ncbi:hypothetical protein MLD38_008378 [Melastoma candidum]|uniref:Uncharacterized protein n=1 Tax=Melastoma candidum TaxID=119954 RepID=A0ACB9RTQ7_9MYRT|nr:hypothetical protein MLD38_008378 [Melastoma candidum]
MKLQERFEMDTKLSYSDFHHSVTQSGSSDYESSPRVETDSNDDDELVKYMSNLPAFLRRPETVQGRTFSVGVLDWGRLEKWQNSHKQVLPRNTRYSTSCSSTSSLFSTELLSSSNSSRGRSCSPIQQRMHRVTLQSNLLASPGGRDPHLFDPLCEDNKHNRAGRRNKSHGRTRAVEAEGQSNGAAPSVEGHAVEFPLKNAEKFPGSDRGSRLPSFQAPRRFITDPETSEKPNKVVLLMPRGASKQGASESVVTRLPDSQVNAGKKILETSRRGPPENARGVRSSKFQSEIPRPTISSEFDLRKQAPGKCYDSMDVANLKPEGFHRPPPLTRVPVTRSAVGTVEARKPSAGPSPLDPRLLSGSDSKANASSEKARSSSPLRRLGHSMVKIVKNTSSREGATGNQHDSARSFIEKAEPLASRDISIPEKSNSAGRSRSSPLRRLLNPIIRPKTSDSRTCDHPLPKSSFPNDALSGRAAGQSEAMNLQSAKAKQDMGVCRNTNDNSHLDGRGDGSAMVQALLRVATKNGLPLLTFAVDNDTDILAATMRNSRSSGKDDRDWSYTFFTIREVRKRNGGWITQGLKCKASNYVPDFVAHMKVSDIESDTSRRLEENCLREFVLLGVDKGQQEQSTPDLHPHDELAAIVTKTPKLWRLSQSQCQGARDAYTEENMKDRTALGSGESGNATVILPSGIHSLPSSGGPSSLIERWRSGGSCDCGGWDVGCKLKILSGDDRVCRKLSSGGASSSAEDSFFLFSQADAQGDEQPVFSLTPFKDKIYSVEFKSSLSVLQAFSICIAFLDSRGSIEGSHLCQVKWSHDEATQQQAGRVKLGGHGKADGASVKYASNPPLSPVGRV